MMGTEKIYETRRTQNYAAGGYGQVVSRSLYAVVERGDIPLDGGFGEAEFIEVASPAPTPAEDKDLPVRVRIDTVPQDTIATSPDTAARAAAAMQSLSHGERGPLEFKVEYLAD